MKLEIAKEKLLKLANQKEELANSIAQKSNESDHYVLMDVQMLRQKAREIRKVVDDFEKYLDEASK